MLNVAVVAQPGRYGSLGMPFSTMDALTLEFIADACGGELQAGRPEEVCRHVSTDSRQVQAGDAFVALRGERFDGHDFLDEAIGKGAAVVLMESGALSPSERGECGIIRVKDTRIALGEIAAAYRSRLQLPMVVVAGSNGKTTTKDLVASVLRQKLKTLWSEASFNNDIGVPLTLLKLKKEHEAAVIEAGTNHPGELAPLVRMVAPQYGIITSIGREHLEFFGDLQGVIQEQGWLAQLLPASGKLLVNGDDPSMNQITGRTSATLVSVGLDERNEVRAAGLRVDKAGTTFRVESDDEVLKGEYRLNLLGRHQVINALFALVLGRELGLSRPQLEKGLAECKPAKMRLQLWELNGVKVLDDAYNANADSVTAALRTLQELPCKGRRVAVLGDMGELGAQSEAAHEEIGRRAAELGVGQLFAVGRWAPAVARGARDAGLTRVLEFADVETAAAAVKQFLKEGDVLLLKASRASRLERVGELLRAKENGSKS